MNSRINKYQRMLSQLVEEKAKEVNATPGNEIVYQAIADTRNNHFLLISLGWSEHKFYYQVLLHLDIATDCKIWIQQNQTEIVVGDILAAQGVDKKDIVIGFHPEYLREHTEYATR